MAEKPLVEMLDATIPGVPHIACALFITYMQVLVFVLHHCLCFCVCVRVSMSGVNYSLVL